MENELTVKGFGKLPTCGDFVHYRCSFSDTEILDSWFRDGLQLGKALYASDWPARFQKAPIYQFIYPLGIEQRIIIGVVKASQDSSGRQYPFVVFTDFVGQAKCEYPLARYLRQSSLFLQRVSALLQNSGQQYLDTIEREANIKEIACSDHANADDAQTTRSFNFDQVSLSEIWPVAQSGDKPANRWCTLENLLAIATNFHKNAPIQGAIGLQIALPRQPKVRAITISFWIAAVQKILGNIDCLPFCFWHTESQHDQLFLFPNPPVAEHFLALSIPDFQTPSIYALDQDWGLNMDSEHPSLNEYLHEPGLPLSLFLDSLAECLKKSK